MSLPIANDLENLSYSFLDSLKSKLDSTNTIQELGYINQVVGSVVYSSGPHVQIGSICYIILNNTKILLEVIGFKDEKVILFPLENITGIYSGLPVYLESPTFSLLLSPSMKYGIFDGIGRHILEKNPTNVFYNFQKVSILRESIHITERKVIHERFHTGIKAIDSMLSVGRGQRMGIFAGSGVGKTTLLTMLSHHTEADINVIALIGERGREAAEFIQDSLGKVGREKSILVVSTSDKSAMERVKAAYVATTIAEFFRDQGKHVLLLLDSLTRFAMAQREIGLAVGEPATSRGYTPSVFSTMPRLLERSTNSSKGSITSFYTVLVEGDDLNDPIADTARGILDGHIVLSRQLAVRGHYPSIDITNSISRLFTKISSDKHIAIAQKVRELLSVYEENRDIIALGAYKAGTDPLIDESIQKMDTIHAFLQQAVDENFSYKETLKQLLHSVGNA